MHAMAVFMKKQGLQYQRGYLYFIGADGCVWAKPLQSNKTGKTHRVSPLKVPMPDMSGL